VTSADLFRRSVPAPQQRRTKCCSASERSSTPHPTSTPPRRGYSNLLGIAPYFDQRFYVGGYELGLDPNAATPPGPGGATAYWGVTNLDSAIARATSAGAAIVSAPRDVGDAIRIATESRFFGSLRMTNILTSGGFHAPS
jgi:hypothetical protein